MTGLVMQVLTSICLVCVCVVPRMWRYKQPGFALRLLCELQKQQQRSLHCDIILQAEGERDEKFNRRN